MGDRGNVCIRENTNDNSKDVYLYTHWSGSELPDIVKKALAKQIRWTDPPYLARIILNEMQGADRGELGFGISAHLCDPENPTVVVDTSAQTVAIVKFKGAKVPTDYEDKRVPIREFIGA